MKKLVLLLAFFACTSVSDARPSKQEEETLFDEYVRICKDVLLLTTPWLNKHVAVLVGDKLFVNEDLWEELGKRGKPGKETRKKTAMYFSLYDFCASGDINDGERVLKSLTVVGADSGKILGVVRNFRFTEY